MDVWQRFSRFFPPSSHLLTHTFPAEPVGTVGGWLTVDCEVHPAAVVEGVVLLLQHQDPTLVPALVLGAHRIDLEGGLPMQRGSTWRQRDGSGRKKEKKNCETRSTTPPIVTKINSYNGGIKWFPSTFSSSAAQIIKWGLLVKIKRLIRYNIFSQRVPGITQLQINPGLSHFTISWHCNIKATWKLKIIQQK